MTTFCWIRSHYYFSTSKEICLYSKYPIAFNDFVALLFDNQANSNTPGTAQNQPIDHRNDVILRQLAPDAFGPYGFDGHRAHLLVRGMVLPPNLKKALGKRCEEELTDRAAGRFAKSLDRFNPPSTKQKEKAFATPASPRLCDYSDRGIWAEETTRELVRLHAKRVPFKQIAVSDTLTESFTKFVEKFLLTYLSRHGSKASRSKAARSTSTRP